MSIEKIRKCVSCGNTFTIPSDWGKDEKKCLLCSQGLNENEAKKCETCDWFWKEKADPICDRQCINFSAYKYICEGCKSKQCESCEVSEYKEAD